MSRQRKNKSGERGGTLLEFAVVASVFFMLLLAICAGSNIYFTHNALVEATRRGARFAATQAANSTAGTITSGTNVGPSLTDIRNYTIYGNKAGTGSNLLNLQPANVTVEYSNFGVGTGSVSVIITSYTYHLVIPGINQQLTMPAYRTTAAGESAGTCPPGVTPPCT
jgi:Flp pilus assembly protein TadG